MSAVIEKAKTENAVIVPEQRLQEARKLSAIAKQTHLSLIDSDDPIERAVLMAHAVGMLRDAITPGIMNDFRALMNTPLGFRTDRKDDKAPYPDAVVKDVVIQSLIRGVRPTGNEFNIIAGNLYITKEGYYRLIGSYPGVSNFHWNIGVPKMLGEGALVPCVASWLLHGQEQSIDCTGDFSVVVKGVGVDQIRGKAESKLFRRVYAIIAGSDLVTPEPDEAEATTELNTSPR